MNYLIVKLNKILIPLFVSLLSVVLTVSVLFYLANENQRITDLEKVNYHRRMIAAGSISSLVTLGEMYEIGQGVEKNLSKAQELFRRAIKFEKLSYSDNQPIDFSNGFFDDNDKYPKESSNKNRLNQSSLKFEKKLPSIDKVNLPKNKVTIKAETVTKPIKTESPKLHKTKSIARTKQKNINKKPVSKISRLKRESKSNFKVKVSKKDKIKKIKIKKYRVKKTKVVKMKVTRNRVVVKQGSKVSLISKLKNELSYKKSYPDKIFKMKKTPTVKLKIKNKERKISTLSPDVTKDVNKNNFTTDPCANESSKYIAKCIRLERMKRFSN